MVKNKIKKEFNVFAKKVSEIETLKQELSSLDSKGFESDVKVIKSRMKHLDEIPRVHRDIESLRKKIRMKAMGMPSSKMTARLMNESEDLRKDSHALHRKIAELEDIIERKRRIYNKGKLTSKEREYIKDIPKLESHLSKLKNAFESHLKNKKVKVDTGIGVLVNSKFDDFVSSLKSEITGKLKEKEHLMGVRMREEFDSKYFEKEKSLRERYNKLLEAHENWLEREKDGLKREFELLHDQHKSLISRERDLHLSKIEANKKIREKERNMLKNIGLQRKNMLESAHAKLKREFDHLKEDELKLEKRKAEESHSEAEVRKMNIQLARRMAFLKNEMHKLKDKEQELSSQKKKNAERAKHFELRQRNLAHSLKEKENDLRKELEERKRKLVASYEDKKKASEAEVSRAKREFEEHIVRHKKMMKEFGRKMSMADK